MKDRRAELATREFDILVIGAGMFGACIAWSAALRGYSVAVIDKGDFANATSSNHYKFIHGGIRYLQHLDIVRLRESSREKSALIRIAPHLAYPMPIVFPTYGHGRRGKAIMRAAMLAYDVLTLDRNRGIPDRSRRTPNGSLLNRDQVLELFPGTPGENLTGAAVFYDGQMYNPARLVLAFLRSAAARDVVAANYVNADELLRDKDKVVGCKTTDMLSGEKYAVRARMVVNAAGPWGHRILRHDASLTPKPEPSFSRDLAFVVNKSVCPTHAIGCQSTSADSDAILDRGGRHLFLVPWRGRTLVGVWHRYSLADPDRIFVSHEELREYVREINDAYGGLDLDVNDIAMINTGHILFGPKTAQGSDSEHSFAKRSLLIDHARDGVDGIVSIVGARATVARGAAEKVMDLVQRKLGDKQMRSPTETESLHGGAIDEFESLVADVRSKLPTSSQSAARSLAHNYGSAYAEVLNCASEETHLETLQNSSVIEAEIIHAVRHEMAKSLADVVLRRTELGSAGDPGGNAVERAAALAGTELGWAPDEVHRQVTSVQSVLDQAGPWNYVDTLASEENGEQ